MRILAALLIATIAVPVAQAGSSGIHNGAIQGVVDDDFGQALAGASVVAVRGENPPIIRSTTTDARGNYFLGDLPMGKYTMGFAKFGYKPITTESGDPGSQTAVGSQVRVFVDSGQTVVAPSVNLTTLPPTGNADVTITLIDAVTGEGVSTATLLVGGVTSSSGTNGQYRLSPIPHFDASFQAQPLRVQATADGYGPLNSAITVVPGGSQAFTFQLNPLPASASGRITAAGAPPGFDFSQISIVVPNVGADFLAASISPAGQYALRLPASSATQIRTFDIQFVLHGDVIGALHQVQAPRTGTRTLPDVSIHLTSSGVEGDVITSSGQTPQGSAFDQAVIVELGRATSITGGTFSFSSVPVGVSLTVQVNIQDPTTHKIESGQAQFTATTDGTASPIFHLPTIVTHP